MEKVKKPLRSEVYNETRMFERERLRFNVNVYLQTWMSILTFERKRSRSNVYVWS